MSDWARLAGEQVKKASPFSGSEKKLKTNAASTNLQEVAKQIFASKFIKAPQAAKKELTWFHSIMFLCPLGRWLIHNVDNTAHIVNGPGMWNRHILN